MNDPWLWAAIVYGMIAGLAPTVFIRQFGFHDDTVSRIYYALLWPTFTALLFWEALKRAWRA